MTSIIIYRFFNNHLQSHHLQTIKLFSNDTVDKFQIKLLNNQICYSSRLLLYINYANQELIEYLQLLDKYACIWSNDLSSVDHQYLLMSLINNERLSSANYLFQHMDNNTKEKIINNTTFAGVYILPLTDIEVVLYIDDIQSIGSF